MKWLMRLAGVVVAMFLLVRLPAIAAGRACSGEIDDPMGSCRHVVAIGTFMLVSLALNLPLIVGLIRHGTRRVFGQL